MQLSDVSPLAKELANFTVEGFVLQDNGNYQGTLSSFTNLFAGLFPELDLKNIAVASKGYTDALWKQDEITTPKVTPQEKLNDPRWLFVQEELEKECKALGIDSGYARHHSEFFRYHSVHDERFVSHCLIADRIFVDGYVRKTDFIRNEVLGGLYFACVGCHDGYKSNPKYSRLGTELITKYYEILLENAHLENRHLPKK